LSRCWRAIGLPAGGHHRGSHDRRRHGRRTGPLPGDGAKPVVVLWLDPTCAFILGAAGFPELTSRLRERQKAGDLEGMGKLVDDDVLAVFATEASWDGLADALRARYAGLSDRLVMYLGGPAWDRDREAFERSARWRAPSPQGEPRIQPMSGPSPPDMIPCGVARRAEPPRSGSVLRSG
jgi:hypothetical protein